MTEQSVIEYQQGDALMPAMSIQQAVQRYKTTVEFVQRVMKKDIDYGVIQGTGKPTLLKPGAEKLTTLFGLCVDFALKDSTEDWDAGRFAYRYGCSLARNGLQIAYAEGSANSLEKRYRYRNIYENKASDDDKARAIRVEERTGKYGPYKVYVVENDDPYTLVNTLQKMAQKRAMIAAVLIAVNASEFFTQDIEDMDFDAGNIPDESPAQRMRQNVRRPRPTNGGKILRPMEPQKLYEAMGVKTRNDSGEAATDKQIPLVARKGEELFAGDDESKLKYHSVLMYLFGVSSAKNLTKRQASAFIDWATAGKDEDTGDLTIDGDAVKEAAVIIREVMKAQGQLDMFEEDDDGNAPDDESGPDATPENEQMWADITGKGENG